MEDLADAVEAAVNTIGNYERDQTTAPDAFLLARVARVVGVTLDWLVVGDGPRQPFGEGSAQAKLERIRQIIDTTEGVVGADPAVEPLAGGDAARTLSLREVVRQTPAEKPRSGKGKRRARG